MNSKYLSSRTWEIKNNENIIKGLSRFVCLIYLCALTIKLFTDYLNNFSYSALFGAFTIIEFLLFLYYEFGINRTLSFIDFCKRKAKKQGHNVIELDKVIHNSLNEKILRELKLNGLTIKDKEKN